jgi:PAS domain S-box-containing protein
MERIGRQGGENQAEASLQAIEHRLQQILDQSKAVVFWKDLDGRYLFVSREFCRLVARPAEAILGCRDEDVMPPEVAARLRANDAQALAARGTVTFEEQGVFLGELRTYLVNKFPLLGADGEPYAVCGVATDISARKRVEETLASAALAVSSAQGASVFEQLVRGLAATLDVDWAFIALRDHERATCMHVLALWSDGRLSENFDYELAGTPCEKVVGRHFRIYPERLETLFPADDDFARLGMHAYAGYPLYDAHGRALGLIAVVTRRALMAPQIVEAVMKIFAVRAAAELERERMDRQLRASEASYRAIFEASEDCIFVHDLDTGAFVDVNPKACAVYGYDHDTMLRLRPGDLGSGEAPFGEADANRWLARARAGEVVRFEWRRRNADGSTYWDEVCLKRIRLAGIDRILAVTRDITARKEAAEAIARSENRLRATVEAALDAIITMDETGVICGFNPAAEACFGLRSDAVLGRSLADALIPERFRDAHRAGIARYLRDGHGPFIGRRVEVVAQRADGSEFPAELAIAVAQGTSGRLFVGYLRDITAQKRAEDERQRLEAQLRQAQKMEAIGHLAGGIAHDFNNILTSINGYLALASERQQTLGDARLGRYLEQAGLAATRARDLIRQLLTFSRGQRGMPRPLSLPSLIVELARFLGPMLPATVDFGVGGDTGDAGIAGPVPNGVEATRIGAAPAAAETMAWVMADPVQLEQVLMNLCINARDALGGRGRIRIGVERPDAGAAVCASCRATVRPSGCVALVVADDGPGIAPTVLERMFEPFFSTKEVGKGSGMGLATVHGIVHEHGGHILVDTAPGRGTIFRVLLPLLRPSGAAPAAASPAPAVAAAGVMRLRGRVLLVDDEEMVTAFLRELLEGWGLTVTPAADGVTALDAVIGDPLAFDLVVTDQTMPRMSGLELARELREVCPGLPVLLISGYAHGIDEESVREAGVAGLLHKPIEPALLFVRLAELLRSARAPVR